MSADIPDAKEDKDITAKRLTIKPFTIVTDLAIFHNRQAFVCHFFAMDGLTSHKHISSFVRLVKP
jgi:hypothetical protein